MENYSLENDIKLLYVTADSFPQGIEAAHKKLYSLLPDIKSRNFFGMSRPENNIGIVYKACVEESYKSEGETLGLDTILLKKGNYISIVEKNYIKDPSVIGRIFGKLLQDPRLDPEGYCVEMYLNDKDVRCMIRLK